MLCNIMRTIAITAAMLTSYTATTVIHAATINWGVAANTVGASDVATTGTLVEAINAAPTTAPISTSVTLNGVVFTNGQPVGSNNQVNFLTSTTGDADLDAFLNDLDSGGGAGRITRSIGNGALVVGSDYLVQVFFTDERSQDNGFARNMRFDDGNAANFVDLLGGGSDGLGGPAFGQFAIGTFSADGSSQTIGLDPQGFGNSHITGYQIRQLLSTSPVPEPSSILLTSVALIGAASWICCKRRSIS